MRQLLQKGNGGDIEGVAGSRLKGADTPFTEDNLRVARGHDVFRTHEQFLNGAGEAAL